MDSPTKRVPPHSLEAEVAVLGGCLLDNNALDRVVEALTPDGDDFYRPAHQKIFVAALELHNRGEPVDLVTLTESLRARGELPEVGGATYVSELTDRAHSAANVEFYAKIVRAKAQLRRLIQAATEITQGAFEGQEDVDEFLDESERRIFDISEQRARQSFVKAGSLVPETFRKIEELYDRKELVTGVPTGFVDLDRLTAGFQPSDLVIVAGRPSMGKCLVEDSEVVLRDGRVATIRDLVERREGEILTLADDWKLGWTRPRGFVDDGRKPAFRIRTRLGRVIETTASHPFRTLDAWRPLAEIGIGERIAVPRRIPIRGSKSIGVERAALLGYLLGDGCLTHVRPSFTNSNPRLRADFARCASALPGVRCSDAKTGVDRTPTVTVSGSLDGRRSRRRDFGERLRDALRRVGMAQRQFAFAVGASPGSVTHWVRGAALPSSTFVARIATVLPGAVPESESGQTIRSNPLTDWLRSLGIWGKSASGKFVPEIVFELERAELATFLNRLFATDGWATVLSSGQAQIGYASSSERLARQVQHLLLRFGVIAGLEHRRVSYAGSHRDAWQLDITDGESIETFAREIGAFGKEECLRKAQRAVADRRRKPNRDTIPRAAWAWIGEVLEGRPWAVLGRGHGDNLHVGKRGLSRRRLSKMAAVLGSARLRDLAESDVYWDEIVSIESIGLRRVYDLTIPGTHNFVANDVCVHNTSLVLNIAEHVAIEQDPERRQGVGIFSLEMSKEQLVLRLLCSQARIDLNGLRRGHLAADDFPELALAAGRIHDALIYIDDTPAVSVLELRAKARRLKRDREAKLGLIVVDYLQLMRGRGESREQEISDISRSLKALAKELHVPVVALSQLNRKVEERHPPIPRMADLRESGAIEQDADVIAFIYRDEQYDEDSPRKGEADIIVAKQRNGPTGTVRLTFRKDYTRFENFTPEFGDDHAGEPGV